MFQAFALMSKYHRTPSSLDGRNSSIVWSCKNDWLKTRTLSSRSQSGFAMKREIKNSCNYKSAFVLGGVRMHSVQSV